MTIKVGDRLPDGKFKIMTADGPAEVSVADYFGNARVALFGVPGAFTPTCHSNHLPGFLNNLDALRAKGVDKVACLSVNDMFVMKAWGEATGAAGKIDMLADGTADYAKALGLELDATGAGLGIRARRFSMLVDKGVVKLLNVEDVPSKAEVTGAAALLAAM